MDTVPRLPARYFLRLLENPRTVVNSEISALIRLSSQCCRNSRVLSINYYALALRTFELANPIMLA